MEQLFNTVWDSVDKLNTIPFSVYNEINILNGATDNFIDEVSLIENAGDSKKKADEALNYLKENSGITEIDLSTLKTYLMSSNSISLSVWRQLYMLERSIPRRANDTHTWVERLKVFADTNTLECTVDHSTIPGRGKLLFTRKSGNHNILHAGRGEFAADFYYWIKEENKPVFVEFKHCGTNDIETAKNYYSDKIYNAKCVIIFTADHKYYFIDYNKDTVEEITTIPVPTDLLIW